jgi:hypothetical protein
MPSKNVFKIPSIIILITGITLLVYLILIKDESGALPLFLVLIGILLLIYNRFKISFGFI